MITYPDSAGKPTELYDDVTVNCSIDLSHGKLATLDKVSGTAVTLTVGGRAMLFTYVGGVAPFTKCEE